MSEAWGLEDEARASCSLDGDTRFMCDCGHPSDEDTTRTWDGKFICGRGSCQYKYAECVKCHLAYAKPSVAGRKRLCPDCAKKEGEE